VDANRLLDSDQYLCICVGVGLFFGGLAAVILWVRLIGPDTRFLLISLLGRPAQTMLRE
jgi:hypothetical protein